MQLLLDYLGQGFFLILLFSLPPTLLAAFIGLIIGILQAVTQVQEQTISAAPKVLFVYLMIIFGGGIMIHMLDDYIREAAVIAFQELPVSEPRILPPQARDPRQRRMQAMFSQQVGKDRSERLRGMMNDNSKLQGGDAGEAATNAFGQLNFSGKATPTVSEDMFLNKGNR